uniref:Uncharacterized protein n=1 Tax=Lepeophtheirus salmonis TaxID=72036 RepID=A0A0K2UQL7_LEPSM
MKWLFSVRITIGLCPKITIHNTQISLSNEFEQGTKYDIY